MDCNPELIAAAQNNTAKLGFSDRFALHTGELADTRFLENLRMEASPVQLVMANPPWRLVGDKGTFPLFASAASSLLEEDGRFACIISPDRLQDMLAALDGAGLTPYLLQYIHKQKTSPATFVLIEARKGAHAKPSVAEPIALYGPERFFTLESLAFCPFLR